MNDYSSRTKNTSQSDEWFTPRSAIDPIIPYLTAFKTIWCPFDRYDSEVKSNYITILENTGHNVVYSHIDYGQDFLDYSPDVDYDAIVSNPPYSLRNQVFNRLYETGKPFAMLMNYAGIFDNRYRFQLFKENGVQFLVLGGRTNFVKKGSDTQSKSSPLFQAIYVCNKLLPSQIVFQ